MAKHKKSKHNTGHLAPPSFKEFDPVDSAAESLAEAVMRKSPKFKREKERLKRAATKALSDSPFK